MTTTTAAPGSPTSPLDARGRAIQGFFVAVGDAVARWTRLDYQGPDVLPPGPALVVANHGHGGLFDLNAFTIAALANRLRPSPDAPITVLTHQIAWTIGIGPLLEPAGFRPASREAALNALAAGHYVLVMPGGDLDASKDFAHRNQIVFGGRTGFATIARRARVPIIPIVVSGAGETLLVLSDGHRLAQRLGLPQLARIKALPISLSIPYGLSVGVAGMLPYLPLPAKMRAAVLDPIDTDGNETDAELAGRVEGAMADGLDALTGDRVPFLGVRWDDLPLARPGTGAR